MCILAELLGSVHLMVLFSMFFDCIRAVRSRPRYSDSCLADIIYY